MSRLPRLKVTLLGVAMLQGFWVSAQGPPKAEIIAGSPSTTLMAQPEGTTLPPRNQDAARDWPVDFRRFIDGALFLFRDGNSEPKIDEFRKKLHIQITQIPGMTLGELHYLGMEQFYRAEASWATEDWPIGDSRARDHNFLAETKRPEAYRANAYLRTYYLVMEIDRNRLCVDPYALAIYTGATFSVDQIGAPAGVKRYEWGMFNKTGAGMYTSNMNFDLSIAPAANATGATSTANCVRVITFNSKFRTGSLGKSIEINR
jgi:hypothetical protein